MAKQSTKQKLERLRKKIDQADRALLKTFAQRFSAVEQIGHLKRAEGLPVVQKSRWSELLSHRLFIAEEMGISKPFVKKIFEAIHLEAIRIQTRKVK